MPASTSSRIARSRVGSSIPAERRLISTWAGSIASAVAWRVKLATKVIMQTPPFAGRRREDLVRHVARHVAQGARVRVAEDHRRGARLERVVHRGVGDVRQVDEHPEAVHLAHHVPPEVGEAVVARLVGGGIGPVGGRVVGQRQVRRARGRGTRAARRASSRARARPPCPSSDAMRPIGERRLHLVGRAAGGHVVGVAGDHPSGEVELLELRRRVPRADLRRHEHAPELPADAAGAEPRQVGVAGRRPGRGRSASRSPGCSRSRRIAHGRSLWPSRIGCARSSSRAWSRSAADGSGIVDRIGSGVGVAADERAELAGDGPQAGDEAARR